MNTDPTAVAPMSTAIDLIGRAVRAAQENKYTKAAKEVANLDLRFPQLTGPPVNATSLHKGFLDIKA